MGEGNAKTQAAPIVANNAALQSNLVNQNQQKGQAVTHNLPSP
jgi:hypothetical protein